MVSERPPHRDLGGMNVAGKREEHVLSPWGGGEFGLSKGQREGQKS